MEKVEKVKERYRHFKEWQKQPHQVAPLAEDERECPTCGTRYQGNYCPRCGQSAMIGRYSMKKAFLLFLDVWGLGNRGMFRTLRDLLLRPGYMIYDYLSGMQMAYFPPFKMFFLIVTLSVLVESGLNLKGENRIERDLSELNRGLEQSQKAMAEDEFTSIEESVEDQERDEKAKHLLHTFLTVGKEAYTWYTKHESIADLLFLLVFSGPLYLFFRHSPRIPDMRFTEFFVAQVYIDNMMMVYSVIFSILCMSQVFTALTCIPAVIALKQLSGYSYWRTILNVAGALSIFGIVALFLFIAAGIVGIVVAYTSLSAQSSL